MQPPKDSDGAIDLTRDSLDELGRVPECRSDSGDLDADAGTAPTVEPRTSRCGKADERELHRNPFPAEE